MSDHAEAAAVVGSKRKRLDAVEPLPAEWIAALGLTPGKKFYRLNEEVLGDDYVIGRLLECNRRARYSLKADDIRGATVDAADAQARMLEMSRGIQFALPPILLFDDDLATLRDEVQRAHDAKIIAMTEEAKKYMGNVGGVERTKLYEAHAAFIEGEAPKGFPLLLKIVDRLDAFVDAHPELAVPFLDDVPIILLREVPENEHSTAATAGEFSHLHTDYLHSIDDLRLGLTPEAIADHEAAGRVVAGRVVFALGDRNKSYLADLKGRTLMEAVAPCDGAAVVLSGRARAQTPGAEQRFVHAGARDDMKPRLQLMPDFSVLCVKTYNRVMARFLLQDAQARPEKTQRLRAVLSRYLGL